MANEFKVTELNPHGLRKVQELSNKVDELCNYIEALMPANRERALVLTKLQEAYFFARKGIEAQKAYQKDE